MRTKEQFQMEIERIEDEIETLRDEYGPMLNRKSRKAQFRIHELVKKSEYSRALMQEIHGES